MTDTKKWGKARQPKNTRRRQTDPDRREFDRVVQRILYKDRLSVYKLHKAGKCGSQCEYQH